MRPRCSILTLDSRLALGVAENGDSRCCWLLKNGVWAKRSETLRERLVRTVWQLSFSLAEDGGGLDENVLRLLKKEVLRGILEGVGMRDV